MTDDNVTKFPVKKRPGGPGRGNKVKQGSGQPASGIPAGGGWGGPAKGEGAGPDALIPGQDAAKREVAASRRLTEQQRATEMKDVLYDIAKNSEFEMARIAAANHLLNRIEGAPLARSINANVDDVTRLTDEELQAEVESLGRTA